MSDANLSNDPKPNETPATDVSPETKAIVDEKLPQESDEIKQHLMALIDAIKRQTQTQMEAAGDVTRDVYVNTMRQAQETLKQSGLVLDDQWNSIESSVSGIESLASKNFDVVFKDFQKWGDRMDRAFNAAWEILTEDQDNGNGGSGGSKADAKPTEVKID